MKNNLGKLSIALLFVLFILKQEHPNTKVINFSFKGDVPAAAFVRANRLWLVFGNNVDIDPKTIIHPSFHDFELIEKTDAYTTLAAELVESASPLPSYTLQHHNLGWALEISQSPVRPKENSVLRFTDPLPRVEIEVGENAKEPITINDTYVGDKLVVLPLINSSSAIQTGYKCVDFAILPSLQGVVIKPFNDLLIVKADKNNYSIISTSLVSH